MKKLSLPYKLVKKSTLKSLRFAVEQKDMEIKSATDFIKEIEQGNLDSVYTHTDTTQQAELSALAISLLSMRDQMKKVAEEEKERRWTTEGLAKFAEILRADTNDLHTLSEHIVSNLVKYLGANQAGLFIVNDENEDDLYLELTACYAYNRKKFLEKKIGIGEGLIGQAYLEKDIIYMTDIPNNYVHITSGLGEARPNNILIVPIKMNEHIFGIVELAAFQKIKAYQIEFVEKLGESIASTISSVKINAKTRRLLEESQAQAEQMRSQEEEMRQNLEELSATQEEMQRVLKEAHAKERYLNDIMNTSQDTIFTIDRQYKIASSNKALDRMCGFTVEKGFDALQLSPPENRANAKSYYDRALAGESFEVTEHYTSGGVDTYISQGYGPLTNENGQVIGVLITSKNVTPLMIAQKQTEDLLSSTQEQAEILRAQEEVMRQSMEELAATQEEMQSQGAILESLLNATKDSIIAIDKEYKIMGCNNVLKNVYSAYNIEIGRGFDILTLVQDDQKEFYKSCYDRALAGESFEFATHYQHGELDAHLIFSYAPLKNASGTIIGAIISTKDVTESAVAQQQAEKLLSDIQQQSDTLKAQENQMHRHLEEFSAIQEELTKKNKEIEEVRRTEREQAAKEMEAFMKKASSKETELMKKIAHLEVLLKNTKR